MVHGTWSWSSSRARSRHAPRAAALDARRRRLRPPGVRGARRGARARHRPPRSQAGEPLPRAAAAAGTPIKVLDFGISKAIIGNRRSPRASREGALTRTTDIFGSPLYMSPEQIKRRGEVDARTDIWALGGVILFELIAGASPVRPAHGRGDLRHDHRDGGARGRSSRGPVVPAALGRDRPPLHREGPEQALLATWRSSRGALRFVGTRRTGSRSSADRIADIGDAG